MVETEKLWKFMGERPRESEALVGVQLRGVRIALGLITAACAASVVAEFVESSASEVMFPIISGVMALFGSAVASLPSRLLSKPLPFEVVGLALSVYLVVWSSAFFGGFHPFSGLVVTGLAYAWAFASHATWARQAGYAGLLLVAWVVAGLYWAPANLELGPLTSAVLSTLGLAATSLGAGYTLRTTFLAAHGPAIHTNRVMGVDELTGVASSEELQERAEVEVKRMRRYGRPLGVLFVDIDDFAATNAEFGRRAGDVVLKTLARYLRSVLGPDAVIGRLGGEEFVALLPGTPREETVSAAEKIRSKVASLRPRYGAAQIPFTVSVGVAHHLPEEPTTGLRMLADAEMAMNAAKAGGKNRTRVAGEVHHVSAQGNPQVVAHDTIPVGPTLETTRYKADLQRLPGYFGAMLLVAGAALGFDLLLLEEGVEMAAAGHGAMALLAAAGFAMAGTKMGQGILHSMLTFISPLFVAVAALPYASAALHQDYLLPVVIAPALLASWLVDGQHRASGFALFVPAGVAALVEAPLQMHAAVVSLGTLAVVSLGWMWIRELRWATQCFQARLANTSTVDLLTGAVNRRGFEMRFAEECAHATRRSAALSLVFLNLDHLQSINNQHGRDEGDRAIKLISQIVQSNIRAMDVLCRLEGDLFAVILPDTPEFGALLTTERLRRRIAQVPLKVEGAGVILSASLGVAILAEGERHTAEDLRSFAAEALQSAKEGGRNAAAYWTETGPELVPPDPRWA